MLSLKSLSTPFSKLIIIYLFWLSSWILAGSLFEVYFYGLGLSIQEIVGTSFFWSIGSLLLAPFFKKIQSKKFMLMGIAIAFLAVASLYFVKNTEIAFVYRFLLSLTHFFFWIPFNVTFYEFSRENNATLAALYYSAGPLLMFVLPSASGLIAANLGYESLYALAMLSYAITFILALAFLKNKDYSYNFSESIRSMSGLKTLIFLEGVSPRIIVSVLLETMLLKYATMPADFGIFTSLTTLSSIIAALIVARISDVKKRRREFVIGSAIAFGIAAILTGFTSGVTQFFIGFSIINFIKTIFFPLPLALVVDNSKNLVNTMLGREILLNVGAMASSLIAFMLLSYFDISFVLILNGIVLLAYPLAFELKKRKLARI